MEDVHSASNDPIFPLHHSFVDRIYEKWLRKYNKDASVVSVLEAPIGHNKHDVIVPLFPLYTHEQKFKKSFVIRKLADNCAFKRSMHEREFNSAIPWREQK